MNESAAERRFLFVTGIVSPFWIELANEINKQAGFDFRIAFSVPSLGERGKHWKSFNSASECHWIIKEREDQGQWLTRLFDEFNPHVAILGGMFTPDSRFTADLCRRRRIPFGYFGEQPNVSSPLVQRVKLARYRRELHARRPRFFLAAGDRAVDLYTRLSPAVCDVAFFPYYQDHAESFRTRRPGGGRPISFLFSGRLIPRNSIRPLTLAFERLAELREGKFTWCVSAYGEEEAFLQEVLARSDRLRKATKFDRDFEQWSDRLRPFASADVLVVPAQHSGWGLVVPEAMACGLAVIATREVEAARFFVEEMVNGMFVKPQAPSILEALIFCVDHPRLVESMGTNARTMALRGDVKVGAERFTRLMSRWFGQ